MLNRIIQIIAFSALTLLLISSPVYGQMFSVQSVQQNNLPQIPVNLVSFGLQYTDFSYFGLGFNQAPEVIYDFNEPVYRFSYENPLLNIFFSYGRNLGPENNVSFTRAGIGIAGSYTLSRVEKVRVFVPLSLNTDYTLVNVNETRNTIEEFAQNAGYIGLGLGLQFNPFKGSRFELKGIPHIGYNSGSFGSTGGVSWKMDGFTRFYIDNIVSRFGLSFGYDFQFIRFNNTQESLNYDLLSNAFSIGITF